MVEAVEAVDEVDEVDEVDAVRSARVGGSIGADEAWGRKAGGFRDSAESDPMGEHNQKIPAQDSAEKT